MIRLENVTKFYPTRLGRHYVLRDVNLHIPHGARLGVLGRNGAGKTTLLRLIGGVDTPNAGRIIRDAHISWPLGVGAGIQNTMTGAENARFCCRIQSVPLREIPAMVEGMREFSELGKFFDLPVSAYSSGMKSRLKFAMAMAFDFDCYIIDELTAVGDASFRNKSRNVFREKRERASFIKVSHGLGELLQECNCGIVVENGLVHSFDSIEAAVDHYRELMGDDSEIEVEDDEFAIHGRTHAAKKQSAANADRQRRRHRRAKRKAQGQLAQDTPEMPRSALALAPGGQQQATTVRAPAIASLGGPLRTSHRPAPMAPRPGKEAK